MHPLEALTELFKRDKGFERLFSLFVKKYKSYERVEKGISVDLVDPSPEEKQAIGGFIGKDFSKRKSLKITAAQMEKAVLKTKFGKSSEGITFQEILEAYYGEPLVSNREQESLFLEEREAYFKRFQKKAASTIFSELVEWTLETKYNRFFHLYKQDKVALTKVMESLNHAFALFPLESEEYLPVFASRATGNPHAFDADESTGQMFIYALQIVNDWEIRNLNAEERAELLYAFHIMTDDLLNFVSVFHARGRNNNGKENLLLDGAVRENAFFHLPLKEVAKLDIVESASGNNRLFMIENSSVASHVVNEFVKHNKQEMIISGNGQFKIATWKFLNAFIKSGGVIYYSGDFDPEGILMAVRLKKRYGEKLIYWKYDVEHYHMSLSREPIAERRLKQLEGVTDPHLQDLIKEIKKQKRSGYQEKIIGSLTQLL